MGRDPHPFHVPKDCFRPDGTIAFPEEEAHHLLRVIRMRPGSQCRVVDGKGGRYQVRLLSHGKTLKGEVITSVQDRAAPVSLELGFPILRLRSRTEWLIEKAVEVGVTTLVPILWSRTVKRRPGDHHERWERIVREAMKQSERSYLPRLGEPATIADLDLPTMTILADADGEPDLPPLPEAGSVRLLIGPEGGSDEEECGDLLQRGAFLWSLGRNRLRAETAAVVGAHRLTVALEKD